MTLPPLLALMTPQTDRQIPEGVRTMRGPVVNRRRPVGFGLGIELAPIALQDLQAGLLALVLLARRRRKAE